MTRSRRRLASSAATFTVLLVLVAGAEAAAQSPADSPPGGGIFFGGTLGGGGTWIEHPELASELRLGAVWDVHLGWRLSQRLAAGGQFSTWGTSLTGTPVHLHTIGLRLDLSLRPSDLGGPFLAAVTPLALTEGDLQARAGGGLALLAGYRWLRGAWTTLGLVAGLHGHLYDSGSAVLTQAGLELRFHGARPE